MFPLFSWSLSLFLFFFLSLFLSFSPVLSSPFSNPSPPPSCPHVPPQCYVAPSPENVAPPYETKKESKTKRNKEKKEERKRKKAKFELAHSTQHTAHSTLDTICMSRLIPSSLPFSLLSPAAEDPLYRASDLHPLERLHVLVPFNPHDARLPQKHAHLIRGSQGVTGGHTRGHNTRGNNMVYVHVSANARYGEFPMSHPNKPYKP